MMEDVYLLSAVRIKVPDKASDRLEKILSYMSQNCAEASLASVAAHFSFHPNTVSSIIKRETGQSFGETLREIRMQRAVALLETRSIPVAQIAQLCGYDNPSNFYRAFKNAFGLTPRAFMEQRDAKGETPSSSPYRTVCVPASKLEQRARVHFQVDEEP